MAIQTDRKTLEAIQQYLEMRHSFTGVPAGVALAVGLCGLGGAVTAHLTGASFALDAAAPVGQVTRAMVVWSTVLLITGAVYTAGILSSSKRHQTQHFSRLARFGYSCQVMAAAVALLLTIGLWRSEAPELIPAGWLLSYSAGVWPTAFVAGRAFSLSSPVFLLCGLGAIVWPGLDPLWLGLGFGGGHVLMAVTLFATVRQ
jgi:hypothetical protein